jgi:hypothetical protein
MSSLSLLCRLRPSAAVAVRPRCGFPTSCVPAVRSVQEWLFLSYMIERKKSSPSADFRRSGVGWAAVGRWLGGGRTIIGRRSECTICNILSKIGKRPHLSCKIYKIIATRQHLVAAASVLRLIHFRSFWGSPRTPPSFFFIVGIRRSIAGLRPDSAPSAVPKAARAAPCGPRRTGLPPAAPKPPQRPAVTPTDSGSCASCVGCPG